MVEFRTVMPEAPDVKFRTLPSPPPVIVMLATEAVAPERKIDSALCIEAPVSVSAVDAVRSMLPVATIVLLIVTLPVVRSMVAPLTAPFKVVVPLPAV